MGTCGTGDNPGHIECEAQRPILDVRYEAEAKQTPGHQRGETRSPTNGQGSRDGPTPGTGPRDSAGRSAKQPRGKLHRALDTTWAAVHCNPSGETNVYRGEKYREMSSYTKVSRTRHENTNRKRKRPVKRTDAQIRTFRSLGEVVQRGRAGGRTGHGGLEPATARKWGNKNSMRKWTTGWRRHFTSKKALMSFVVKEL